MYAVHEQPFEGAHCCATLKSLDNMGRSLLLTEQALTEDVKMEVQENKAVSWVTARVAGRVVLIWHTPTGLPNWCVREMSGVALLQ